MNMYLRTPWTRTLIALLGCAALARAQEPQPAAQQPQGQQTQTQKFVVPARTRIPLVLVNSVSTKTSDVGDQVYLQTSFPISANGQIVIPEGSYVTGTITQVKRPGKVKGRAELYVRFDTLMLRNGVKRDFRGTVSATDGSQDTMSEKEGKIIGDSSKGQDAATIAGPAVSGTVVGAGIGGAAGGGSGAGMGAGIGAGIGATAGMIGVLLTRGPDVHLVRGTSLEMQLDRDLTFFPEEVNFTGTQPIMPLPTAPASAQAPISDSTLRRGVGVPGIPWP
jgi:type IV secretion system protein VirB10